jgi:hypothetical protein
MLFIEGDSEHRLKGTNLKWEKCRLWRRIVQNGVAPYKFLRDRNVQIGGELERHEEGSLRRSLLLGAIYR